MSGDLPLKMNTQIDIIERATRHVAQQFEIYADDVYLEKVATSSPSADFSGHDLSLQSYFQKIKECTACRLADSRKKFVFGVGNESANLMCIGEAPGRDEDMQGEPFVGAAGQLLNKMLAAIGFAREEVYIANVIKCRPPSNRDPEADEVAQCLPFLRRQVELVNPKIILVLGRIAARHLLHRDDALSALREEIHTFMAARVVVTYHPAALLRNSQWKRKAWQDVQKARFLYDEIVGDKSPFKKPT